MTFITSTLELKQVIKEVYSEIEAAVNAEKLYTFTETANLLGIGKTTIYRWVESGKIVATADRKYISRAEIDRYLNGKSILTRPATEAEKLNILQP
jgi:excisionase family DNA binding protein